MSFSLVWERDLKKWIDEWWKEGRLRIEGMTGKQRVPKLNARNLLVWEEQ